MDHLLGAERLDELDIGPHRSIGRLVGLLGEVAHVLGANADDDLLAVVTPQGRMLVHQLGIDGQALPADDDDDVIALDLDVGDGLVHRRRTHEAGDEQVVRVDVDVPRRARLLQDAAVEDGHAVAHRHGFDLVVRDVQRRDAELLLQLGDLGAHLAAELGVEVRERFVHEERRRLADDRAAHRHPLALTPESSLGLRSRNSVSPRTSAA